MKNAATFITAKNRR